MTELAENLEERNKESTVGYTGELISPKECARRCGLTPEHVRNLCREGKMPAFRFGKYWRIKWDDCLNYLRTGPPLGEQLGILFDETPEEEQSR